MTEDNTRNASFIRWQKIAIDQLGYTLNLIFTLTIAALGYCFVLLKDKDFIPWSSAKCAVLMAFLLLSISAVSGFFCILNRLWDIRGTARRAKGDPEAPSRDELRGLGRGTWYLFHCHALTFAAGVASQAVALLLTYGHKLVLRRVPHTPPLHPMPILGGWRILKRLRRLRVAYPLRFCFVQRVGNSLLRFDQPPTMRLWRPALAAYHP